ncbi:MAG: phosphonate ABC transporter ATP-binding protein [Nitrospinales bacterium]
MLRLENISKNYGDSVQALKDISFEAKKGEFIIVLGQSGSGKSTLLRCINRLVEPTSGKIFLDDEEITAAGTRELREIRSKIGMVFQDYNLVKRSSALTNVLSGSLGGVSPWFSLINYFYPAQREKALEIFEQLDLEKKVFQRASHLSGGQQQRVGIGRALMQRPSIILADEPVSSLDPASVKIIMETLREINNRDGVTIICNLHLPELAKEYGHRIIGLKKGHIAFDGPVKDFIEDEEFYSTANS